MRKHIMIIILITGLSTGLLLSGCGSTASPKPQDESTTESSISGPSDESTAASSVSGLADEETESSAMSAELIENTNVVQGGPYGEISLCIPDSWNYDTYPIDNGQLMTGLYGIHFCPQGVNNGYIELTYADWFGVCGTGLEEEMTTIAGHPVNIGTYDNKPYWGFITFGDDYKGIVALTYGVDDWWETYHEQVMDILNTLTFDSDIREGGAYIYSAESEIDKIGLSFSLKNISPAGATLVFDNYDADAPTGTLEYGDDFILEIRKDGAWEEASITLDGNYGFNALAYMIPSESSSEQELHWEWLYGTLAPGTYRIQKSIMDFRGTGDYDKYTIYAQFILN